MKTAGLHWPAPEDDAMYGVSRKLWFGLATLISLCGPGRAEGGATTSLRYTDSPVSSIYGPGLESRASSLDGGVRSEVFKSYFGDNIFLYTYRFGEIFLPGDSVSIVSPTAVAYRWPGFSPYPIVSVPFPPIVPLNLVPSSATIADDRITFNDFMLLTQVPGHGHLTQGNYYASSPILTFLSDADTFKLGVAQVLRGGQVAAEYDVYVPTMVPEPSTLLGGLLAVALAGAGYRWRRRRAA